MEPFKAKKLSLSQDYSPELVDMISSAREAFGEYKGYLKNLKFDFKSFLDLMFVNDTFYSFKIDGVSIEKGEMFYMPYKEKDNISVEFQNMRKAFVIGLTESNKKGFDLTVFNKVNKSIFLNCKKDNLTKGSGSLRKKQIFLLKPGLAGSSVSYVPPIYTELNQNMKDLCDYINNNDDKNFVSLAKVHYQFEKIHPYISGNGVMGRLLIPVQFSFYRKETPLLFISKSIFSLKNTYFTMLSDSSENQEEKFIKFFLKCVETQCEFNIKKIKELNKIYEEDYNSFSKTIGGTTIYKVYPTIIKKMVFTTADIVNECKLHINSVNKVLNKLVESGYLIKEKKKNTNRVTFCYKKMHDIVID